jgi:WhiB family redox-sensing transcriptional regulator
VSRIPNGAVGANYDRVPEAEDVVWQLRGLCTKYDPDLFQPETEADAAIPKRICLTCPVMMECQVWALTKHEHFGVWGGLSAADRESIWAGRPVRHRRRKTA